MKFDELLVRINGFGKFQKRTYFFVVLINATLACTMLMPIFILGEHQHTCRFPDGAESENITVSECAVYFFNKSSNITVNKKCTEWSYEPEWRRTPVSDFDLVCDEKLLKTHASMALFGGNILGATLSGLTGDIFGRKFMLMTSIVTTLISSIVCSFAPNYTTFVAMRLFTGLTTTIGFEAAFIISTEIVDPGHRVIVGIGIELLWCVGELVLCAMAYIIGSWRTLTLVLASPYILFLSYGVLVTESPRWLLSQGRKKEALEVLNKIASVNGTTVPETHIESSPKTNPFKEARPIFRSCRLTCRLLVLFFTWFVISLSYYGLTLNVGNIGGDVNVNFLASVVVEALGYLSCIVVNDRFGRKWMNCGGLVLAGVACLSTIFTTLYADKSLHWITITLSMVGKFGVCGAFGNIFIYTAELFPTTMRTFALSFLNIGARVGSVLSPYVAELGVLVESQFGRALPIVIFGCLFISAGCLSFTLPETMGTNLPETIDDILNEKRDCETKEQEISILDLYEKTNNDHDVYTTSA